MQNKNWQWRSQTWVKCTAVFFIYLFTINSLISIHPLETTMHSVFFLRWPIFACALAYWLLTAPHAKKLFLQTLIIVCALIMLDCIFQYLNGTDMLGKPTLPDHRLSGPYSAPVPGIMLLRVLFVANFALLIFPKLRISHYAFLLQWLFFCVCVLFLMLTGERMALLLYIFGLLIIVPMLVKTAKIKRRDITLGLLVLLGMFTILVLLAPTTGARVTTSIYEKITHFGDSDYGLVFKAALEAWQQHIWFGSGLHTYREVCNSMGLLTSWEMSCTHPHNLYLLLGAETGVIGVIIFCVMIFYIYKEVIASLLRQKEWWALGLSIAALTVCFFPLIGGISLWNNWVAALVWATVGWTLAISQTLTAYREV